MANINKPKIGFFMKAQEKDQGSDKQYLSFVLQNCTDYPDFSGGRLDTSVCYKSKDELKDSIFDALRPGVSALTIHMARAKPASVENDLYYYDASAKAPEYYGVVTRRAKDGELCITIADHPPQSPADLEMVILGAKNQMGHWYVELDWA